MGPLQEQAFYSGNGPIMLVRPAAHIPHCRGAIAFWEIILCL